MPETEQQTDESLDTSTPEPEIPDFDEADDEPARESNFFLSRARLLLLGAAICLAVTIGFAIYQSVTQYPKRFKPVVEGQLYRSGEVSATHLEKLRDERGIKRVICLLNPDEPVTIAERKAAEELGLDWINLGMGGSGQHTPEQVPELIALLTDPNAPPTLVHCAAGVNRTGLAIGLYRIHNDGWSYDQVHDELLRHDFDDLPKHEQMRATLRAEAERMAEEKAAGAEN